MGDIPWSTVVVGLGAIVLVVLLWLVFMRRSAVCRRGEHCVLRLDGVTAQLEVTLIQHDHLRLSGTILGPDSKSATLSDQKVPQTETGAFVIPSGKLNQLCQIRGEWIGDGRVRLSLHSQ